MDNLPHAGRNRSTIKGLATYYPRCIRRERLFMSSGSFKGRPSFNSLARTVDVHFSSIQSHSEAKTGSFMSLYSRGPYSQGIRQVPGCIFRPASHLEACNYPSGDEQQFSIPLSIGNILVESALSVLPEGRTRLLLDTHRRLIHKRTARPAVSATVIPRTNGPAPEAKYMNIATYEYSARRF